MSTAQNPKQRLAFTDKDRQRLRWYHNSYPSLTPHQLASWFESEAGRRVATSSIYDILSDKYAYLDNAEATDAIRKKKGPQWAELEDALFKWWQEAQPRDVTGKELKTKANEIWQTLPACQGKKAPSFSDGWLSNWRVRHGLAQSTRAMGIELGNSEVGRTEDVQCALVASVPCARQSIPSAQFLGLTVSNSDPPFTLPIERRLHFEHMNLPYSAHQISVDSQFLSTWPSTTKSHPAIVLSNKGKTSFRIRETRANGRHKVKRAKLTVSRPLDAANFQDIVPCPKPPKAVAPADKTPWKGVQELFSKCNALKEDNMVMTGNVVVNSFKPILSSLEYSNSWLEPQGVAALNIEKAIRLFVGTENFRVQQSKDESQHLILEEWLLEFINHEVLRSHSPECAAIEGQSPSSCNLMGVMPFRRPKGSQRLTTNISPLAKDGRVHIRTQTYTSLDTANGEQATQHFQANIVITPPATLPSVPQTVVHLATQTTRYTSTLWTPTISFRTIIPKDSMVFKIAKSGTSTDLQMILSSGEASLSDCDPEGRSLINYALHGRNSSTLKFVLTTVADVDTYEASLLGHSGSLVAFLMELDAERGICERHRRLTCLKLMLDAGADPSLHCHALLGYNTFESELLLGTVTTLKALLDLGLPYVSANTTIDSVFNEPPLLFVARNYNYLFNCTLDMHEKIFLLLERGAYIAARNRSGETCLHIALTLGTKIRSGDFEMYQEEEFKDILMCMVTAGADVYASNANEQTISQIACNYGHEELWRVVLAECGYDPDEVFSLDNDFRPNDFQKCPGIAVFSAATPVVRPTKLSFAEYSRQRKSLACIQKVYSREDVDIKAVRREAAQFWESTIESSDSEDYEWMGVEEDDEEDDEEDVEEDDGEDDEEDVEEDDEEDDEEDEYDWEDEKYIDEYEEYSDVDEAYNGDDVVEGYPKRLHDGVYWQSTFS